VRVGRWRFAELNLWGTWTTDPANGMAVRFSLLEPPASDHALQPGYRSLTTELHERFGAPAIVDHNPLSPHALWCRGNLTVSVDAYTREPGQTLIQVTIAVARTCRPARSGPSTPEFSLSA
jgi:hypothetical protein